MAAEFLESDKHELFICAEMVDVFWSTRKVSERTSLAREVRLSGQRFGLSPIDRQRSGWAIEDPSIQSAGATPEAEEPEVDPRQRLHAVK